MKHRSSAKVRYKPRSLVPFGGVAVLVAGLAAPLVFAPSVHAASTSLYLAPATATVTVNNTLAVAVRISTDEGINAVGANLTYDAGHLQFLSIDASGTSFSIEAPDNKGGGGSVTVNRGNISGITGDKLVATVKFKALTGAQTSVKFASGSQAYRSSDSSEALSMTTGGNYNLVVATATPTSPPPPPPAPQPTKVTNKPGSTPSATPPAATTNPGVTPPATSPQAPADTPAAGTSDGRTIATADPVKEPLTSKTAVIGASSLLVIAAAVGALVFFRRKHDLHPMAAQAVVMGSSPRDPAPTYMPGGFQSAPSPQGGIQAPQRPANPVFAQRPLPGAGATPGMVMSPTAASAAPAAPQTSGPAPVPVQPQTPLPAPSAPASPTASPSAPNPPVPPAPPAPQA